MLEHPLCTYSLVIHRLRPICFYRMQLDGWRDRKTSSLLMVTWHGDLATAQFLVATSCVTLKVLRQQQWIALPGRDSQSEAVLEHWRQCLTSPDSLTRLCRCTLRRYFLQLTNDTDIRAKLQLLPLPVSLKKFVNLDREVKEYLEL